MTHLNSVLSETAKNRRKKHLKLARLNYNLSYEHISFEPL